MNVKKADILLLLVLITMAGAFYLYSNAQPIGSTVIVYSDGMFHGEYPLDINQSISVTGIYHSQNVIAISQGQVLVTSADCPDQICVRQGRISKSGASIICIPNRLSVKISGADALDGIVY